MPPVSSVYVHFPWCLAKCPYCDFVSYAATPASIDHEGYADAVVRELDARADALGSSADVRPLETVTSVFFGGGTPSLWDPRALGRVLAAIEARLAVAARPELEVTVECNPTSLDADRARALADVGVNRLSVGTQSLRADQLAFLGRLHDVAGARRSVEAAVSAGVRVSTDLIFGLHGQSPADAAAQATELASLGLSHLSCYQLTIEPGTQFGARHKRGLLPVALDEDVASAFLAVHDALADAGLEHYEISNFAKPGERARHNVAYWRGEPYVGLGCAAVGFARRVPDADGAARGVRWKNEAGPERYVEATRAVSRVRVGEGDGLSEGAEELAADALLRERIMLGLRMRDGIDLDAAGAELGVDPWTAERARAAESLAARGRIERRAGWIGVPAGAWLFTDDTAARLF